jgi:hypothetical protein
VLHKHSQHTFQEVQKDEHEAMMYSDDEMGRKPVKILGTSDPEGGPGPEYVTFVFVFPSSITIC